jgi:hypothetical protein
VNLMNEEYLSDPMHPGFICISSYSGKKESFVGLTTNSLLLCSSCRHALIPVVVASSTCVLQAVELIAIGSCSKINKNITKYIGQDFVTV